MEVKIKYFQVSWLDFFAVKHAVLQSHKAVKSCALCSVRFVYELFLRLLFGTIYSSPQGP